MTEMVSEYLPLSILSEKLDESPSSLTTATVSAPSTIPVLRPSLPPLKQILPFLHAIEQKRWYSNYGPLNTLLEKKLSLYLHGEGPCVVTAASATAGLTATLLAFDSAPSSLCLMPSWTFAATAHAARAAGMAPFFHDVDAETWALDPRHVMETLHRLPMKIGAVIAVSPFGCPLDIKAWEALQDETGIPVLIDAAASFDTVELSRIPFVVSLHATKILAAGEGGFVTTTDSGLLNRIRTCSNFGFSGARTALLPAVNSKMSEYHAAVALADFYRWVYTRPQHVQITDWYRKAIASVDGVKLQPGYGNKWVSSTTNVLLSAPDAAYVSQQLLAHGIETRSWWGQGCHVQPAFAACPRGDLDVTEYLGSRVLGLPHFVDLKNTDVHRVRTAFSEVLDSEVSLRPAHG